MAIIETMEKAECRENSPKMILKRAMLKSKAEAQIRNIQAHLKGKEPNPKDVELVKDLSERLKKF